MQPITATENTKKRDQKGLIFMNEHEELTKEERELEMICKEIEWNSKRIISDRSRKRIKGLYYNKGLPIQSLRTLVDMAAPWACLASIFWWLPEKRGRKPSGKPGSRARSRHRLLKQPITNTPTDLPHRSFL